MIEEVKAYRADGQIYETKEEAERMDAATEFVYALDPLFSNDVTPLRELLDHMRNLRSVGAIIYDLDPDRLERLTQAIRAVPKTSNDN